MSLTMTGKERGKDGCSKENMGSIKSLHDVEVVKVCHLKICLVDVWIPFKIKITKETGNEWRAICSNSLHVEQAIRVLSGGLSFTYQV